MASCYGVNSYEIDASKSSLRLNEITPNGADSELVFAFPLLRRLLLIGERQKSLSLTDERLVSDKVISCSSVSDKVISRSQVNVKKQSFPP